MQLKNNVMERQGYSTDFTSQDRQLEKECSSWRRRLRDADYFGSNAGDLKSVSGKAVDTDVFNFLKMADNNKKTYMMQGLQVKAKLQTMTESK